MENSDENWSKGLFQELLSLSEDRIDADVIIRVENQKILAHKFVLDTNSSIMKLDNIYFEVAEKKFHVTLSEEFGDKFELLCDIVKSLYTGVIEVKDEDANLVYKFAKSYNVEWLKSKMLNQYESMLSHKTFVTVFQFAHTICCDDVKALCLDYLTERVCHTLMNNGELLRTDYYCIKTICSAKATKFANLSEMKKFELVCRWFESNVPDRICHLENLLSVIEFNIMTGAELTRVFDRILQNKHIDEDRRMNLMKEVNRISKAPINENSAGSETQLGFRSSLRNLGRLKEVLSNEAESLDQFHITFQQFYTIVRNFYQDADQITKRLLLEFLVKKFDVLITNENITNLIKLNTSGFTIFPEMRCQLSDASKVTKLDELIQNIRYQELPVENMINFIMNTKQYDTFILRLRILECVMNWALKHPEHQERICSYLNHLCLCNFPTEYLISVLGPYLKAINNGMDIPSYHWKECAIHKDTKENRERAEYDWRFGLTTNRYLCRPARKGYYSQQLTPEIRMIQQYTYHLNVKSGKSDSAGEQALTFKPRYKGKGSLFELSVKSNRRIVTSNPLLVIFSSSQCMESFPVLSKCDLQLDRFREMIVKYSDLSFLLFL